MPTPIGFVRISASPACCVAVAADFACGATADHGEAVDRLRRVDRVTACYGNAGGGADVRAALQDVAHDRGLDLAERHAENRERHERPAAHRVHVRQRVRRRDAAEVGRVVDDRREEIRRRDHAGVADEPPHRRIVTSLGADEQIRKDAAGRSLGKQLLQHRRRELAAAAAAVREARESDWHSVHQQSFRALRAPFGDLMKLTPLRAESAGE